MEFLIIFFSIVSTRKTPKNNVPVLGIFQDPSGLGHITLLSDALFFHKRFHLKSKISQTFKYSYKRSEIELIDKVIKGQSLKTNFHDILASEKIDRGPKKTQAGCYVRYMVWAWLRSH